MKSSKIILPKPLGISSDIKLILLSFLKARA